MSLTPTLIQHITLWIQLLSVWCSCKYFWSKPTFSSLLSEPTVKSKSGDFHVVFIFLWNQYGLYIRTNTRNVKEKFLTGSSGNYLVGNRIVPRPAVSLSDGTWAWIHLGIMESCNQKDCEQIIIYCWQVQVDLQKSCRWGFVCLFFTMWITWDVQLCKFEFLLILLADPAEHICSWVLFWVGVLNCPQESWCRDKKSERSSRFSS